MDLIPVTAGDSASRPLSPSLPMTDDLQEPAAAPPAAGGFGAESVGGLAARIQRGEPGAEAELAERYGEGLLWLLRRWTRDAATAEDLRQETLRLGLEKIRRGEIRDPDRLPAFLQSLAKNLSTQFYRRTSERPERRHDIDGLAELPDPAAGPLSHLLRREAIAQARQTLEAMASERDRQVLVRFYIAEEDTASICSDLNLTVEHFYRVLHRARQRYRRLYEDLIGTERVAGKKEAR